MQELLGRLKALDPATSQSLRVIACFDELIAGDVGVHGLLSAAAALAGRPVCLARGTVVTRVDSHGGSMEPVGAPIHAHPVMDDVEVWIENPADETAELDAIILERLALALLIRLDTKRTSAVPPRDMTLLLERGSSATDRRDAAARLGLATNARYRIVVAPLFATWTRHPRGPEDVVATPFGPVHAAVVDIDAAPAASPVGIGSIAQVEEMDRSFRTAMIALRLHDGSSNETSRADDLGGLAEMLADLPDDRHDDGDQMAVEIIASHRWGAITIDALVRSGSVREAARIAHVHHSTMTDRVEIITDTLGFDPMSGIGRTRMNLAFLRWRLRTSRVLELVPTRNA